MYFQCSKSRNYRTLRFKRTSQGQWAQPLAQGRARFERQSLVSKHFGCTRGIKMDCFVFSEEASKLRQSLFICLFILCYLLLGKKNLSLQNHFNLSLQYSHLQKQNFHSLFFCTPSCSQHSFRSCFFTSSPQQSRSCLSACPRLISFSVPQAQRPASALPPPRVQQHHHKA